MMHSITNDAQVYTVIHHIISNFKTCTVALMPENVTTFIFSPTHIVTALEEETHNDEL